MLQNQSRSLETEEQPLDPGPGEAGGSKDGVAKEVQKGEGKRGAGRTKERREEKKVNPLIHTLTNARLTACRQPI